MVFLLPYKLVFCFVLFLIVLVLRSAMIADYMFWLCGGSEQCISKLIKLYWQVKIDVPMREEESISFLEPK